jgi:hypothetical protein
MSKLRILTRYGQVPNSILNDGEISLRAKGLFAFLQSKPDDWKFSIGRISKQSKEGKSAIRSALNELEAMGFLRRTAVKNRNGKFIGYDYELSDLPSSENRTMAGENDDTPLSDLPSSEKPSSEKPSSENYDTLSKKDLSKQELVKKKKDIVAQSATDSSSNKKSDPDRTMTLEQFISWCAQSPHQHIRIIGDWAETTEPEFQTVGQWTAYIKRNLRPAKELTPFTHDQLSSGFRSIKKAIHEGWLKTYTMETLFKFITNPSIEK